MKITWELYVLDVRDMLLMYMITRLKTEDIHQVSRLSL